MLRRRRRTSASSAAREAAAAWPRLQAAGTSTIYLAYLDGEPVGFGRAVFTPRGALLLGGATLPAARGHGVYTSLVHARWAEAVERGVPRLIVAAPARCRRRSSSASASSRSGRVRLFKQKVT